MRNLPGTYLPQILKYGNTDHGIVYNQISMTINIALGIVSLPSSGLAMTLNLLNRINRQHIINFRDSKKNSQFSVKHEKCGDFFLFSDYANLSYAIQAFVIAAPMPDSEPMRANI